MELTKEKPITRKTIQKKNRMPIKNKKNTVIITITVIAFLLIVSLILSIIFAKDRNISTIAEASLKEIIETNELSTVEFIYNSTVTVSDVENNPKYHIAYEGTVKAGFDFNQISIKTDEENKKILITIPKIKITSVNINDKTMDYIFVKDKYNTETTFQEAYKICYSDLENKAKTNKTIKKMAYENAVDTMTALMMPFEKKLPEDYVLEFTEESETK